MHAGAGTASGELTVVVGWIVDDGPVDEVAAAESDAPFEQAAASAAAPAAPSQPRARRREIGGSAAASAMGEPPRSEHPHHAPRACERAEPRLGTRLELHLEL